MRIAPLLGCALLCAGTARGAALSDLERAPAAQALPALTQRLCDALAPGDKGPWLRLLSARFEQVDESGAHLDKKQLLDGLQPLPPGLSGTIEVQQARVADFGGFAVVRYDLDENEQVFDQHLHVLYRATDVWRREQGRWRQVSQQIMTVAQDPRPLPLDAARLDGYVGLYSISGHWNYRVERQGAGLSLRREGHDPKPMIAMGDNVFVTQGDPLAIQYIFLPGSGGKAQRIVERRKFADLEMVRVPEPAVPAAPAAP
jgi:hypothetical protein